MRSARTLFASAAVTAVLAISVPAAHALTSAEGWEDSGSSSSSDHEESEMAAPEESEKGAPEKSESWKKEESEKGDHEKSESWKKEKPDGGVHTGGGALALSGGSLAAGSLLMLGGLGAGAYQLRRRNASGAAAA